MKTLEEKKDFIKRLTGWYQKQYGVCACLGNCEKCGHHICFGCACWILEEIESTISQTKQELIEEIKKILDNEVKAELKTVESDYADGFNDGCLSMDLQIVDFIKLLDNLLENHK